MDCCADYKYEGSFNNPGELEHNFINLFQKIQSGKILITIENYRELRKP
jgi:hypothetical protein